jgi:hypothetical protein
LFKREIVMRMITSKRWTQIVFDKIGKGPFLLNRGAALSPQVPENYDGFSPNSVPDPSIRRKDGAVPHA